MSDKFLGIDVAKSKFDVALLGQDGKVRHRTFANKPEGFSALRQWLSRQGVEQAQACLEATGTYGVALATHLHEAGLTVSVVNPGLYQSLRRKRAAPNQDRPGRCGGDRPLLPRLAAGALAAPFARGGRAPSPGAPSGEPAAASYPRA
jgi:hypothetical protein